MQKYKHIIDNSEEGLIIIAPDNKVDYFNETFFRFFKLQLMSCEKLQVELDINNQIINQKYSTIKKNKKCSILKRKR